MALSWHLAVIWVKLSSLLSHVNLKIKILTVLTWNQHFFKDTRCERSIFCWILSEITVFAVTCWNDNKYRFFCIRNISKRKQASGKKHVEHCLTHLNKTAGEIWTGFGKVHFCAKNLMPFFHRTLQLALVLHICQVNNTFHTQLYMNVKCFSLTCTKTRNNEMKRPKWNHRNHRNETTETSETSKIISK